MSRSWLFLVPAVALSLLLSGGAAASNVTLRTTVNVWSKKLGADAHSVALAAQRRHPRRMSTSGSRFRSDALRARAAVAAQKPSTAAGARARRLALTAFTDYARAGAKWAASGRARLAGQRAASVADAAAGARYARAGNRLLLAAGKLLH